jgi:hypothetical protein
MQTTSVAFLDRGIGVVPGDNLDYEEACMRCSRSRFVQCSGCDLQLSIDG